MEELQNPPYRPTRPLPYTLNERARVCIEETLFPSAVEFINSIVIPGTSTPSETPRAAFIPPSTFQRCITTIIAHPYYTSQVSKNEPFPSAPANAYLLLRRMVKLVGPLNADLDNAWDFKKQVRGGRRPVRKGRDIEVVDTFTTDDDLNGEFATTESLFTIADDLWGIVGWAFTCSVSHPKRWKWWKLVLGLLLDVLENDWTDRIATNAKTGNINVLEKSLVAKYLPETRGSAGYKRVIRAILANDNGKNFNEWKEVWKDELSTKRPKKVRMGSQDNTYMGDDTEDEEETAEDSATKMAEEDVEMDDADDSEDDAVPSVVEEWGGMDAVILRQRFLSLVSKPGLDRSACGGANRRSVKLSTVTFSGCYISMEELYHEFKESIIRLSLPSFMLFTSTFLDSTSAYKSSLNKLILDTIISSKAPVMESNNMTAEALIKRYLPYSANTTLLADNIKVALLAESLMRLMILEDMLKYSPELEKAVQSGVKARAAKVGTTKPKPGTARAEKEKEMKAIWDGAEARLGALVMVLKSRQGTG